MSAIFRLGTFYEKGMSVKKDVDIARRYYQQAAERGNAKAMIIWPARRRWPWQGRRLQVRVAMVPQGGRSRRRRQPVQPRHPVCRGIGVEQNLAESFKWFSLAAAEGDVYSGRKRDDIAKRLDAQSLAAAKLAIQTFTPEPQPDAAVNVATPAGGWDPAPAPAAAAKPAAKSASTKRAAAAKI